MKTSMETIETPLSKTVIPYQGRWKNIIFRREHQRIRRRETGLKQRVRILDDGTKYVDVYPQTTQKYERRPKVFCELCNVDIYNGRWKNHLESVKHKTNENVFKRGTQFHTKETDQSFCQSVQCE